MHNTTYIQDELNFPTLTEGVHYAEHSQIKKNQTNILSNASFCIGSQASGPIWYKICFKNLKQGQNIGQQCDRTKFGIELVFMEV